MTNNDLLRSIRYLLKVNELKLSEITKLTGFSVSIPDFISFLRDEKEEGYKICSDEVMAHFLNGLVIYKRGKDDSRPPRPIETPITNNIALKKIRVAFELKDEDILALLKKNGLELSKSELSALFRKKGHANYRDCGDQMLRNLFKGLSQRDS